MLDFLNSVAPSGTTVAGPERMEFDLEPKPEFKKKAAKKAPKKSEKVEDEAEAEDAEEIEAAPTKRYAKKEAVTKERIHEVLQEVNAALGLPAAREILKSFDAQRMSELKEDMYPDFIARCNEAIAGA